MAQPASRQEFIDYCKRQLGAPVLEVNVAEEQISDLIDDAIQYFQERHFDGVSQMYLKYRSDNQSTDAEPEAKGLTESQVTQLKGVVGAEGDYDKMMEWAGTALQEDEIKMYDAVMDKGDPLAAFFAVQALAYRFNDSRGVEGQMLQGKAPTEKGDSFRSQAEVVRAMSDPKYDSDPAYRQDIYDKLERSNLKF